MPEVHGADKVMDPVLKTKTQARREGIPKPISIIPQSVSQPQRIITPVLPRERLGRAGVSPKFQPLPQPQPGSAPPPTVVCRSKPPTVLRRKTPSSKTI